jgi:hypothetical protein
MRKAPKGGYDFSRKRDYRRKVWASFREALKKPRLYASADGTVTKKSVVLADAHALLMPSLEGDEIDVALNAGFREQNLHVVDMNPAIVATLKRSYPKINTYGCEVGRAVERIADAGFALSCANLDFCNQISAKFVQELFRVVGAGVYGFRREERVIAEGEKTWKYDTAGDKAFRDPFIVAVSCLRGRESGKWTDNIQTHVDMPFGSEDFDEMVERLKAEINSSGLSAQQKENCAEEVAQGLKAWYSVGSRDRQRLGSILQVLSCDGFVRLVADAGTPVRLPMRPTVSLLRAESYLSSSGQTMLWGVFDMESTVRLAALESLANSKRASMGIRTRHESEKRLRNEDSSVLR